MKIKEGYLLRQVAGQSVVLPADDTLNINMMITLNGTGAFLWKQLENETDADKLVAALMQEYEVDEVTARSCVAEFVKKLNDNGFLV